MDFEKVLAELNENQRKAVETIDGTVMVVAGPGTGKTQVLGARVANILKQTDVYASNILCLTFTEAATVALRNRLYSFIGPEAHRVNIYTYHGFCNMVIQDNKDAFGIQGLEPVSELEQLGILKEQIDDLPNGHLLKRYTGDQYYDTARLSQLFNFLKRENISHNEIEKKITKALELFKENPKNYYSRKYGEFNKGDLKKNQFEALVSKLEKLKSASLLLQDYNHRLKAKRRYDFNDMILWVLDLFESNSNLLLYYQEQFQYFLVDEYQDTNGAQNDLLYKLINYWDVPNVFVVGDDDQSIYKFQGANVENVFTFYSNYKDSIELIALTNNYRSSQKILDVSSHVIKRNNERLVGQISGLSKDIIASHSLYKSLDEAVKIYSFENVDQENIGIGEKIIELVKSGVEAHEIAILYKEHKQSEELIRLLESKNISYSIVRSQNVLEQPIVLQLINLLTYLSLELERINSGEHLLFEILYFNNFRILKAIDVARISRHCFDLKSKWREELLSGELAIEGVPFEALSELKQFMEDVDYWIKQSQNVSTQVLIEKVMSKAGFISRALASPKSSFDIQCLKSFYNFVKEETAKMPFTGLVHVLDQVKLMNDNSIALRINDSVNNLKGVNFMTIYGSKGLEFEHVFIVGCTSSFWEKKRKSLPFGLSEVIAGDVSSGDEEEARRLFYVGLTRAKKSVSISYSNKDSKGKDLNKAVFVVEAEEHDSTKFFNLKIDSESYTSYFTDRMTWNSPSFKKLHSEDFIQNILDNFRINATNLNAYLKCPITFFYQNIIRVPSAKNEAMTFGTAIHDSLERFFNERNTSGNFDSADKLVTFYHRVLESNKESFTRASFERKQFYGEEILTKFYNQYIGSWQANEKTLVEVNIKNVEIDGVPIRGKIDKIEINNGSATVVDYKTGKHSNGKKKINRPVEKLPEAKQDDHQKVYGGDYWRQILFYKILIDSDPNYKDVNVVSGIVDFVEPENNGFHQEKIVISNADYSIVKNQIKETYSKIQNREFDQGCGKDDCYWCNFQKYYLKQEIMMQERVLDDEDLEMEER